MNRALAIRTIQLLARLPELHVASYETRGAEELAHHAEAADLLTTCRVIIEDAAELMKDLKDLCVTSAESTPAKMAPSPCSAAASSTLKST